MYLVDYEVLLNFDVINIYKEVYYSIVNYNYLKIDNNINVNSYGDIIYDNIIKYKIVGFNISISEKCFSISNLNNTMEYNIITIIYVDITGNLYFNSQLHNVIIDDVELNIIDWNKELFIKPFSYKYDTDFYKNYIDCHYDVLLSYYYNSITNDIVELEPYSYLNVSYEDIIIAVKNDLLFNILLDINNTRHNISYIYRNNTQLYKKKNNIRVNNLDVISI